VARNAPQPPFAGDEATAGVHLLYLAHSHQIIALLRRSDEHRPEQLKRQTGPVVKGLSATTQNPLPSLQMALFAYGVSQPRIQLPRIHNGVIFTVSVFITLHEQDVQLARAVTSFAANSEAAEDGDLISIESAFDRLGAVAVAEETFGIDRPLKMNLWLVTGRKIPNCFLCIPTNGGLEQVPVTIDEIGSAMSARSNGKMNLGFEGYSWHTFA
jgi:hypothetical protein